MRLSSRLSMLRYLFLAIGSMMTNMDLWWRQEQVIASYMLDTATYEDSYRPFVVADLPPHPDNLQQNATPLVSSLPSIHQLKKTLDHQHQKGGITTEEKALLKTHGPVNGIVHVVQTRFMQHQANLTDLGAARLLLLQHIPLASLSRQSNVHFLWILRVDPDLDHTLLDKLVNMTTSLMPNVIIVGSNANPNFVSQRHLPAPSKDILAGSAALYRHYQAMAYGDHSILLETRLDADDALWTGLINNLQDRVIHAAVEVPDTSEASSIEKAEPRHLVLEQGRFICVQQHIQWTTSSSSEYEGVLDGPVHRPFCITPGLSWAVPAGSRRKDWNMNGNHRVLHKLLNKCEISATSKTGKQTKQYDKSKPCLDYVQTSHMGAFRARTVTSHSMAGVMEDDRRLSDYHYSQGYLWKIVKQRFNIDRLGTVRQALRDAEGAVAEDALQGLCTPGHSCKEEAKERLTHVMETHHQQDPRIVNDVDDGMKSTQTKET